MIDSGLGFQGSCLEHEIGLVVLDVGLRALLLQLQATLIDLRALLIALGVLFQFLLLQCHQRVFLVTCQLLL